MSDKRALSEKELLEGLAQAVLELDVQRTGELAQAVLDQGFSARRAILEGLSEGMRRVGGRFCTQEYFVPEVLVAARAMYRGLNLLKPRMLQEGGAADACKGRILIAVVEGDLHDIGKNIVKLMLEAEGFEVVDLGKNVSADVILDVLEKDQADILALSTLMTSTLEIMGRTVDTIKAKDRQQRIIVGGAPVSEAFARDIGADGTAEDASSAVKLALKLMGSL